MLTSGKNLLLYICVYYCIYTYIDPTSRWFFFLAIPSREEATFDRGGFLGQHLRPGWEAILTKMTHDSYPTFFVRFKLQQLFWLNVNVTRCYKLQECQDWQFFVLVATVRWLRNKNMCESGIYQVWWSAQAPDNDVSINFKRSTQEQFVRNPCHSFSCDDTPIEIPTWILIMSFIWKIPPLTILLVVWNMFFICPCLDVSMMVHSDI
jgi:hypothetical protein